MSVLAAGSEASWSSSDFVGFFVVKKESKGRK